MLVTRLKLETQEHHRQIEATLNLTDPGLKLQGYRYLLTRFLGYYVPWESRVQCLWPSMLNGRAKTGLLKADLASLGMAAEEITEIPLCPALPSLDTRAQAIGSMYVTEGSTLGGQILSRHFSQKFGFSTAGCRFFAGYGSMTGAMWKGFGELTQALPEPEWNEAVRSALATFDTMQAWLSAAGPMAYGAARRQ